MGTDQHHRAFPSRLPHWAQFLSTRWGMVLLICASLGLLLLAGIGGMYLYRQGTALIGVQPMETPPLSLSELATEFPEIGKLLTDPDLDSAYKDFLLAFQQGGLEAAWELARSRGMLNTQNELRLTLELDTQVSEDFIRQLEGQGIHVTAHSGNLIDIGIPYDLFEELLETEDPGDFLESITDLEHVVRVRLPRISTPHWVGKVELESLSVINAKAWHEAGFRGRGVKVGIIDLGFDGYKDLLGTDLPVDVVVRSFVSGIAADQTGTTHGTSCAEIIHDVAPDATLFMAAFQTDVEYRMAVDWLVAQGIHILSGSTGSEYGPMDGTGEEARFADSVVDRGVLWVNAIGNEANVHYRGTFTDEDKDGYHEFSPSDEMMKFIPQGKTHIVLNWDAWAQGDQDYDLLIYDDSRHKVASSENIQDGPGDDAAESLDYTFKDEGPYYVVIYARRISRPGILNLFVEYAEIEYPIFNYSVTTPADSRKVVAVGAVHWANDALEDYSSRGPTNDGRIKPDLTAPSVVSTVMAKSKGKWFDGTSASAPHVAGAAALVKQAFPDYSVQQMVDFLKSRAVDRGPSGPDFDYGYGRLWLGDPHLPGISPTTTQTQALLTPVTSATITPTSTSAFSSISPNSWLWVFLLGCVFFSGLAAVGGLGLVGALWYYSRSYRLEVEKPSPPAVAPTVVQEYCPRCSSPLRKGARFCPFCGYKLTTPSTELKPRCIYCGQVLRPNSKFCSNCGHRR